MRVTLRLEGYLSWYAPGQAKEVTVDVPPDTTARQAVKLAKLPYGEVAFAEVAGEQRELDAPVSEGERITLIPPVSGG